MAQKMLDIIKNKEKRKTERLRKPIIMIDLTDEGDAEKMAELKRLKKWAADKKKEAKTRYLREELQRQAQKNQLKVAEKTLATLKRQLSEQKAADEKVTIAAAVKALEEDDRFSFSQKQMAVVTPFEGLKIAKLTSEQIQERDDKIKERRLADCKHAADVETMRLAAEDEKNKQKRIAACKQAAEDDKKKRLAACKQAANDRKLADFQQKIADRVKVPKISEERIMKLTEIERQRQISDDAHAVSREEFRLRDNEIILAKIKAKKQHEIAASIVSCTNAMEQHLRSPIEYAVDPIELEDYDDYVAEEPVTIMKSNESFAAAVAESVAHEDFNNCNAEDLGPNKSLAAALEAAVEAGYPVYADDADEEIMFPIKVSALESHLFNQHEKLFTKSQCEKNASGFSNRLSLKKPY